MVGVVKVTCGRPTRSSRKLFREADRKTMMINSCCVIFNQSRIKNQSRITPNIRLKNQVKYPTADYYTSFRYLHNHKQPPVAHLHARVLAAKVTNSRRQSSYTFKTRSPASLYGTMHTYVFTLRTCYAKRN